MNFKPCQVVRNNGRLYQVQSVSRLLVWCEKNGKLYSFTANELEIVSSESRAMKWHEDDIDLVEKNLHLSNHEIGLLVGRSASAVANIKERRKIKTFISKNL